MKLSFAAVLFSMLVLATAIPTQISGIKTLTKAALPSKRSVKKELVHTDFKELKSTASTTTSTRSLRTPISERKGAIHNRRLFRLFKDLSAKHPSVSDSDSSPCFLIKKFSFRKQASRFSSLPVSVRQTKLSGEDCSLSSECAAPRVCSEFQSGVSVCAPPGGFTSCDSGSDCTTSGEICAETPDGDTICVSEEVTTPKESPTPAPGSEGGTKLTAEQCSSSSECAAPRVCSEFQSGVSVCAPPGGFTSCDSGSDCTTSGEICAETPDGDTICVSEEVTTPKEDPDSGGEDNNDSNNGDDGDSGGGDSGGGEGDSNGNGGSGLPSLGDGNESGGDTESSGSGEGSESNEEPCIAVHSLQHLTKEELVFEKDRLANVLCDKNDSCATPGHMVSYDGRGMMMKSYCEIVGGCVKKVMHVNSPRYRKGITVPSKSENMVFTAFSARYFTRTEEGFLSMAIRLGF